MTGNTIGWVGSLQKIPLAEVLRKIAQTESSGDLQVIFGRTIKTVYFDRGFVVFAASNLKRDRLGESMIEYGRISRHQFALATMLMKNSRRKFGQALVQAGLLSEEEMGRQVALQVNKILISLFKVSDGIYSFDERPCIIPVNLMVSLSIYRIILDGTRRMSDEKLIRLTFPSPKFRLRVSKRPPFTYDFKRLKPVEQEVLRAAGTGASVESISRKVRHDRLDVIKACYGLYSAGLLSEDAALLTRPMKVQEETGAFILSEIEQKFSRVQATNVRQEILLEFDRLDRAPDEELLNVGKDTSSVQIQKAYQKKKRDWAKKAKLVQQEQSMVTKLEEIQNRLDKAYSRITTSHRPAKTEVKKTSLPVPEAPALEPLLNPPPQQEVPALPPLDETLLDDMEFVTTPGLPPPDLATVSDTQPEIAGLSSTVEKAEAPAEEPEKPSLSGAQRQTRILQLYRDVKLHFQVRDWEGAVSLLQELVKLAPTNASYHSMLGRAMARHPVMRKDAERHFIEALRLAPQSADTHFSLGLYYKSFGLHSRADTEFRTVLRIEGGHEGARKHLSGNRRRKDPLRDMFKKIFG
jgi:tetratricopeptide (TPR) repeat protein